MSLYKNGKVMLSQYSNYGYIENEKLTTKRMLEYFSLLNDVYIGINSEKLLSPNNNKINNVFNDLLNKLSLLMDFNLKIPNLASLEARRLLILDDAATKIKQTITINNNNNHSQFETRFQYFFQNEKCPDETRDF